VHKILFSMLISASASTSLNAAERGQLLNIDIPPLADNQEVVMLTLEYQPGESGSPHRHNAHTFVYVLEGSVVMQVKGEEVQVLNPGDTFYENPDDIHTIGKNASDSEKAKFLVFLIKTKGDPILVPHSD